MPTAASAQANERVVGLKVGLVTSSTSPFDAPDFPATDATTGLTAGAFGRLPLGERLAAQGELLFARLGTDIESSQVRSSRLQVPVVLQYVLGGDRFGLRAYAGPMIGFELSCSNRVRLVTSSGDDAGTAITRCPFGGNAGGVSLVTGGLVDIPIGASLLTLDLRYNHGLDGMEARGMQPDFRGFRGFAATMGLGFRSPRS